MRPFEVEKDKKVYLVVNTFHYLVEGIGTTVDLLAIDYADGLRLKVITSTDCKFLDFHDDINGELAKKLKDIGEEGIEKI
jgi:hypothetical protein